MRSDVHKRCEPVIVLRIVRQAVRACERNMPALC
jgi:hypothetical protein